MADRGDNSNLNLDLPAPTARLPVPESRWWIVRVTKNHWRLIAAVLLGILLVSLAFTPAGPAAAAAFALGNFFAPVFTWLASLGKLSILVWSALAVSGFILGAAAWCVGMILKEMSWIAVALSALKDWLRAAYQFCRDPDDRVNLGIAVGMLAKWLWPLWYFIGGILYPIATMLQVNFLFLAKLGDKVFRKLGAPLMRWIHPVAPSEIELNGISKHPQYYDYSLQDSLKYMFFEEVLKTQAQSMATECHEHARNPWDEIPATTRF